MFVVFDLDGTLSDDRHRLHLLPKYSDGNGHPSMAWEDYAAYHAACLADAPILPALRTLEAHLRAGHRVEIWTGRSEDARGATLLWFDHYGVRARGRVLLRMRSEDGSTAELKRRWLAEYVRKPDLAYDDREDCVAVFREAGVACFLLVAPGSSWVQQRGLVGGDASGA